MEEWMYSSMYSERTSAQYGDQRSASRTAALPQGKSPLPPHSLHRRLGGPQSGGEKKHPCPCQESNSGVQPVVSHYRAVYI
jgi:hypothetical protein